jgi:hypothetical protein
VYLALFDLEVYSLENLLAFDGGVEVFDVELARLRVSPVLILIGV